MFCVLLTSQDDLESSPCLIFISFRRSLVALVVGLGNGAGAVAWDHSSLPCHGGLRGDVNFGSNATEHGNIIIKYPDLSLFLL